MIEGRIFAIVDLEEAIEPEEDPLRPILVWAKKSTFGYKLCLGVGQATYTDFYRRLTEALPEKDVFVHQTSSAAENIYKELAGSDLARSASIVVVTGFEDWIQDEKDTFRCPWILNLNATRGLFGLHFAKRVLFWIPPFLLRHISHGAPDFYSVCNGVHEFETVTDGTLSRGLSTLAFDRTDLASKEGEIVIGELSGVLERYRKLSSRDFIREADVMQRISEVATQRSHLQLAKENVEQALEIRTRQLGKDHPETLKSRYQYGVILFELGDFARAESVQRRVLEDRRRVLGESHPDTLKSMNALAIVLQQVGTNLEEVERLFKHLLEVRKREFGPDHRDTLVSQNNLGLALASQGRLQEAERMIKASVEGLMKRFGVKSSETLSGLNNLAWVLSLEGRKKEARDLYGEVLKAQVARLGEHHEETLRTKNNLEDIETS